MSSYRYSYCEIFSLHAATTNWNPTAGISTNTSIHIHVHRTKKNESERHNSNTDTSIIHSLTSNFNDTNNINKMTPDTRRRDMYERLNLTSREVALWLLSMEDSSAHVNIGWSVEMAMVEAALGVYSSSTGRECTAGRNSSGSSSVGVLDAASYVANERDGNTRLCNVISDIGSNTNNFTCSA